MCPKYCRDFFNLMDLAVIAFPLAMAMFDLVGGATEVSFYGISASLAVGAFWACLVIRLRARRSTTSPPPIPLRAIFHLRTPCHPTPPQGSFATGILRHGSANRGLRCDESKQY
ncbi:hypothetical protein BC938DRAFT_479330 [Jimgerdemannia flammicorona]|uniref:Uncharacterized protein n=1 Tax=Jimgerdemannia flammicorona TaxID=994334 RepID=A0A433QL34_9FUNG|nr:hypothetical protein BC938DRAFT_479330 [Jimgerdemannia flammicorona]